ncbi:MAG: toxin-activating lysine-acyltransferase [Serratia proteamaculans]
MKRGNCVVQCPLILGGSINEAEVLGSAVWLWLHSSAHRDAPLHTLPTLLLPIIKHRQYVLVSENNRPVFYMSWGWFSEEAEKRYLTEHALLLKEEDWCSGDRMWVMDWVAPFGHNSDMAELVLNELFPGHCFRSLWHKGKDRGIRVKNYRGTDVSRQQFREWKQQYPLQAEVPEY